MKPEASVPCREPPRRGWKARAGRAEVKSPWGTASDRAEARRSDGAAHEVPAALVSGRREQASARARPRRAAWPVAARGLAPVASRPVAVWGSAARRRPEPAESGPTAAWLSWAGRPAALA